MSDKCCVIFDIEHRRIIAHLDAHARDPAFSPDSRLLAYQVSGTLVLYDLRKGKRWERPAPLISSTMKIAFSPNGETIAVSKYGGRERNRRVQIVNAASGERTATIHSEDAGVLAWLPDGKRIITGGRSDLRVWDAQSGKLINTFVDSSRHAAAFHATQATLVTGVTGRSVQFHQLAKDGAKIGSHRVPLASNDMLFHEYSPIALSANGTHLAAANNNHIFIWNTRSGDIEAEFPVPFAVGLGFAHEAGTLIAVNRDGIYECSLESGNQIHQTHFTCVPSSNPWAPLGVLGGWLLLWHGANVLRTRNRNDSRSHWVVMVAPIYFAAHGLFLYWSGKRNDLSHLDVTCYLSTFMLIAIGAAVCWMKPLRADRWWTGLGFVLMVGANAFLWVLRYLMQYAMT